ncbi:MAG: hypothetical protein AAF525_03470 [Pseudomonadota bacterium]
MAQLVLEDGPPIRVLCILSSDFGEMGYALHLTANCDGIDAHLLLPHTCAGRLDDTYSHSFYHHAGDVYRCLGERQPDLVLLCSGYLLMLSRRFSFFGVQRLLRRLHVMGIPVATSDPFIGLRDQLHHMRFDAVLPPSWWRRIRAAVMRWRFRYLSNLLRDIPHIYPASDQRRPLGAFNRHMAELQRKEVPGQRFYVLSEVDLGVQLARMSLRNLAELLVTHLGAGDGPTIVLAPSQLTAEIETVGVGDHVKLYDELPYLEYQRVVIESEFAFYWNIMSFSVYGRLATRLPVFFFHSGHMVEIMPALIHEATDLFYAGRQPRFLSIDHPLKNSDLRTFAAEDQDHLDEIRKKLESSRSSEQLLRHLVTN